jgi:DNA-binding MarR family transcriptional regulator
MKAVAVLAVVGMFVCLAAPAAAASSAGAGGLLSGLLDAVDHLLGPPAAPGVPGVPGVPSAPAVPGMGAAPEAPPLGPQTVGADMQQRVGVRGALDAWGEGAAGFGDAMGAAAAALGPEAAAFLTSTAGFALSGLATLAAGFYGFRHIHRENLLENTFRHQVLALLRASPGLHLREVARRLGTTTTNASYHLRMLEKHGLICSERTHGKRVYVPASGREEHARNIARSVALQSSRASILRDVTLHVGTNQCAIAGRTGQRQGAVSWHVRQLVEAGLIEERRTPRECMYQVTSLGREACGIAPLPPVVVAQVAQTVHLPAPAPLTV